MNDILAGVQKAFRIALDVDPKLVSLEAGPDDIPAWDSMGHVALAGSLEEVFNIHLDTDDLMEMENIRSMVRVIGSKLTQ